MQLTHLQDHYVTLCVEGASQTISSVHRLDAKLADCDKLGSRHPLQKLKALGALGSEYFQEYCAGPQQDLSHAQAVWDGVCLWLARRLEPIPGILLNTVILTDVIQCLERYVPCMELHGPEATLVSLRPRVQNSGISQGFQTEEKLPCRIACCSF